MSSFRMPRADCHSLTRTLSRIVAALSLKSVGHDARVVVQTTFIKSWSEEAEAFPEDVRSENLTATHHAF